MMTKFSLKACVATFCLLCLALFGFISSKSLPSSSLHSVTIPLFFTEEKVMVDVPIEGTQEHIQEEIIEDIPLIIDKPKAVIAIIIYDYGLSPQRSEQIFEQKIENLTVSLSPYSENPSYWIETAYRFAGEPWGSVYVSADQYKDYGPLALLKGQKKDLNAKRLDISINHATGTQGFIGYYEGNKSIKEITHIYKTLQEKNISMAFISPVTPFSDHGVLHSSSILEHNKTPKDILSFLETLKKRALKTGVAFGALPPHPLVLKNLKSWVKTLAQDSIQIVPLSALQDYIL